MNIRFLGPSTAATININGRSYSGTPGGVYDIVDGADAESLGASGWAKIALSGPTSARPTTSSNAGIQYSARLGLHYLDTTLSKLIVWDGATWRDPTTGGSV